MTLTCGSGGLSTSAIVGIVIGVLAAGTYHSLTTTTRVFVFHAICMLKFEVFLQMIKAFHLRHSIRRFNRFRFTLKNAPRANAALYGF